MPEIIQKYGAKPFAEAVEFFREKLNIGTEHWDDLWAAQHANIRYVPVLSAPAAGDAWTGRTGFVHQAVLADFADLSGHQVYACGSPAMIDSAKRDFMAQGLPEEEFFADAFSFASN